jgi:hypothetical protein
MGWASKSAVRDNSAVIILICSTFASWAWTWKRLRVVCCIQCKLYYPIPPGFELSIRSTQNLTAILISSLESMHVKRRRERLNGCTNAGRNGSFAKSGPNRFARTNTKPERRNIPCLGDVWSVQCRFVTKLECFIHPSWFVELFKS